MATAASPSNSNSGEVQTASTPTVPCSAGRKSVSHLTSDPAASVRFLQSSLEDLNEEQLLDKFLLDGCGCRFGPKATQCCAFLDRSVISKSREDYLHLESSVLDLVVLSCIQSHLCLPDQQTQHVSHHPTQYNSQTRSEYSFRGVRICQSTFLFVHALSHSRYE